MNHQLHLFQEEDEPDLLAELRTFRDFGESTLVETVGGLPYFINEFWTARQRQAHRLHEVSYRACFKPQLPAFFIERLTAPGDVVYDPFMGRGTTPIEAALRDRIPYGNDTNPLSRALTEPRINPPTLAQVKARLGEIPWGTFDHYDHAELLTFYHPTTLAHIEGLRAWLMEREKAGLLDQTDRWVRMVALNRLTGHSAGFFSVYTLPPNQAVTVERQRLINEKRKQTPPPRDVAAIIAKKSASLLSDGPALAPASLFLTAQSDATSEIPEAAVALTVTSPPFLDIVNYESDNWLRCWFMGIDPTSVKIAMHRKVEAWQAFIASTLHELARITRPGGHIAFEVGEVRNGKVRLEENVIAAAEGLPLTPLGVMINQQEFTKTSNCWGVSNNEVGTNSNRIVLLKRDQ
ncbi:DNA methyltransferase [Rubellimicrobium mesophilum]|uniref:DNA methyltransferase n=1 Tax=Rubellimicrobium mesophilum TaxID=1123067 RepID=UPI00056A2719|nr:DNA methyltransferase [Rubellimicrobium mesophilum]